MKWPENARSGPENDAEVLVDPECRPGQFMDGRGRTYRPVRMTIHPKEVAALHRLLDAYTATEGDDPGMASLVAIQRRLEGLYGDHSDYATAVAEATDETTEGRG